MNKLHNPQKNEKELCGIYSPTIIITYNFHKMHINLRNFILLLRQWIQYYKTRYFVRFPLTT